ncbi:unnamed protein product [Lymnaea stagnalis]|uniref:Uncharacterized protein n=1 Tax=Lymnaea stagnalis TaxID=6523 RepID=A0AAV2I676_LYMST
MESSSEQQQENTSMEGEKENETATDHIQNPTDSISFEKLKNAVEKSIQKITSKRNLLYIKEHFRDLYRADSKNVTELYKSMMSQLESMIKEEIDLQIENNKVKDLLNNLDKINLEYRNQTQRKWRPSGNPEEDIKAHMYESNKVEVQQLEKILSTLESQNKYLNERVVTTNEKLQASIQMVESHCSNWHEAANVISDTTKKQLIDMSMNPTIFLQTESHG